LGRFSVQRTNNREDLEDREGLIGFVALVFAVPDFLAA